MLIKELVIKNFRSYYGENRFEFSEKNTLILAGNGCGKTTVHDALAWLLQSTATADLGLGSDKKKHELSVGDRAEVAVTLRFEHCGDKEITKRFSIVRKEDSTNGEPYYATESVSCKGYEVCGVERREVNGYDLIRRCFDFEIQRFTMFKGEEAIVTLLEDKEAFKTVVNKYSAIRQFTELKQLTKDMKNNAEKAYNAALRKDETVGRQSEELITRKESLKGELELKKEDLARKQNFMNKSEDEIQQLFRIVEHQDLYATIKSSKEELEKKIASKRGTLSTKDKRKVLLDEYWILCAFEPIFKDFKAKCHKWDLDRRTEETEYQTKQAKLEGKQAACQEFLGNLPEGVTPLPDCMPDEATMQEMLDDECCKVCGRTAVKGSEPYLFMKNKLNLFRQRIVNQQEEVQRQPRFVGNLTEELYQSSFLLSGKSESMICKLPQNIVQWLQLEDRLSQELRELEEQRAVEENNMSALLSTIGGGVTDEELKKKFADYKGLQKDKERYIEDVASLKIKIKGLEEKLNLIEKELNQLSSTDQETAKLGAALKIFQTIDKAVEEAQEKNLKEFLSDLEKEANNYLEILSRRDFHGKLLFRKEDTGDFTIKLCNADGSKVAYPSKSQAIQKDMAVIFAISQKMSVNKDTVYPLIFDAPTSDFDASKIRDFYENVTSIDRQCIILTKDFISAEGDVIESELDGMNCKVYHLSKAEGLNKVSTSTIQTKITSIK